MAIAMGKHASLTTLERLTDNVLQLDASTDEEFRRFVDWVTQSVVAQSRNLSANAVSLAKLDEGILTKTGLDKSATVVDEDFVVLTGRCQNTKYCLSD